MPRNARAFVRAVAKRVDLVQAACDILRNEDLRGKKGMLEKILEISYGKAPAAPEAAASNGVKFVWDLPAPAREREGSEEES